jgi:hypothetical protein
VALLLADYTKGGSMAGATLPASALSAGPDITRFLHVKDAAIAAAQALNWPTGPVNIVDDDPAPASRGLRLRLGGGRTCPDGCRDQSSCLGLPCLQMRTPEPTWRVLPPISLGAPASLTDAPNPQPYKGFHHPQPDSRICFTRTHILI